jgi:hypothetical protein
MSVIEAVKTSRAPMLTLGAVGVFWGGLAGLMPDIKAALGASDAAMGTALILPAFGSMIAMALAPRIGRALGGWTLPVAGLGIVAAFFLLVLPSNIEAYGAVLFFAGGAVALADMSANVRIAQLEARRGLHLQNVNHAVFSVFFGFTALGVGFARKAGAHYTGVLPVLALVALAAVLAGWDRRALPPVAEDDTGGPTPPWSIVALAAIVLFAGFIGENATEAWSALHIERTLHGPAGEGSFGPATLGFVMALGRFSGQLGAARFGEVRLIVVSAALGVIGALVLAGAPTRAVALVGVAVLGAGMAVIVPSTNSILGRAVSDAARPLAISRAWTVGLIGFFVGPSMMGGLAQIWSLRVSFAAVAAIVAMILPAVLALGRRAR